MSNLRRSFFTFIGLALVIGLIVTVRPVPTEGRPGDKPASDVNVANTPTVNAKQSGPWSVGINPAENTVKVDSSTPIPVRAVEQPYSVYLTASSTNSSLKCALIPVPEGMRLTLETVTISANKTNNLTPVEPEAYVSIDVTDGVTLFVANAITIPLAKSPLTLYAGHLQTRVVSGATVNAETVTLSLCAGPYTSVRGEVFGSLRPQ
jgi:hypothetical protein